MRPLTEFEWAALLAVLATIAARLLRPEATELSWSLIAASSAMLLVALIANPMRWQLLPVAVIILIQTLITARGGSGGIAAMLSAIACVALLAFSATLASAFPAGRLPAPGGPFEVGTTALSLTRRAPDEELRHLSVKLWYPAEPLASGIRREPLWSEIQRLRDMPAIARALLAYLARVRTHSVEGAAARVPDDPYPLIVYHHSLVSFASENTLLMEWLASRGYVVLSVRHDEQVAEQARTQEHIPEAERRRDRELQARLAESTSRTERAELASELYRNSTGLSAVVGRRAADSRFVLSELPAIIASIPGAPSKGFIDAAHFGALGLSLGGAVATQLCVLESRCAGAVNLDGGLHGVDMLHPLGRPYLMVYSEANAGGNDVLKLASGATFTEYVLPASKHLNLHDAAVVLPGLKWFGMLGPGNGTHLNRSMNVAVTRFFDTALKQRPTP